MSNFAGLKVVMDLRTNGETNYPNFNTLQVIQDAGMDWAQYIDAYGKGWIYDKKSGHQDDDPDPGNFNDSPMGKWIGLIIAPVDFVNQAVAGFPENCTRISNAECETFHDQRCTHDMDEVAHDNTQLQNLYFELQMLNWLSTQYTSGAAQTKISTALDKLAIRAIKALDEDDENAKGITKNKSKKWVDRKALQKINFIDP